MALVTCPECGREISDRSPTCIHCGFPLPPKPKNVIRRCGNGQIVLEKSGVTLEEAESYVSSIINDSIYEFSFKYKSGSKYEIVDADSEIDYVVELKNVVRLHGDQYVLEASNLSQEEAETYIDELKRNNQKLCEALLKQNDISSYNIIKSKVYEIVNAARQKKLCKRRQTTVKGTGANRGFARGGQRLA